MTTRRKIAFLSYYSFPCSEAVMEYVFARELGKKCDLYFYFQSDLLRDSKWHNANLILFKKMSKICGSIFNKILDLCKVGHIYAMLLRKHFDIILVRDMPFQAFIISFLKIFFKFKLYYQYTAPLGEMNIQYSRIDKGIKRKLRYFSGILFNYFLEKAYRHSDLIFTITDFHRNELAEKIEKKIVTLTMGVDTDWLNKDHKENDYLKEIKYNNYILTYFGTLNFNRNPEFIFKVFAEVKMKISNVVLLIMGRVDNDWEEKEIRKICSHLKISEKVIFTGQLDRNSLLDNLRYCDLSLSPIPPTNIFRISSPTKIYESLGAGVPVVANRGVYEQEKVISESDGGLLVDYDVQAFAGAISELLPNKDQRRHMSERGKSYVIDNYDYKVIADAIAIHFE